MRDFIRFKLRENFIKEIGTTLPVRFTYTDDEDDTGDLIELNGSYYEFKIGDETIRANFKLKNIEEHNGVNYYDYEFNFLSNNKWDTTNNIRTFFPKIMTIKEIVSDFIKRYKINIESNDNKLSSIIIVGMGNKDKGEDYNSETQRTKIYDYFVNKFKPSDFKYVRRKNLLILKRIEY